MRQPQVSPLMASQILQVLTVSALAFYQTSTETQRLKQQGVISGKVYDSITLVARFLPNA
jgi:hypothetical protein